MGCRSRLRIGGGIASIRAALTDKATLGAWGSGIARHGRDGRRGVLDASEQQRICQARAAHQPRPGPPGGAASGGRARRSTRSSRRHGVSRRGGGRSARRSSATNGPNRAPCCTWTSSAWARFDRPGHWATGGQRSEQLGATAASAGPNLHVVIDDHSRLAYVELHGDEGAGTNTRTLERALGAVRPARPTRAPGGDDRRRQDLQRSASLRDVLARAAPGTSSPSPTAAQERQGRALHPRQPRRMGQRQAGGTPPARDSALATFLHAYNHRRPHSGTRRPATHEPRSQPPWAGQLARERATGSRWPAGRWAG